jgi:hypothetical protein
MWHAKSAALPNADSRQRTDGNSGHRTNRNTFFCGLHIAC